MKSRWILSVFIASLYLLTASIGGAEETSKGSKPGPGKKDQLEQECNDALAARKKAEERYQEGEGRRKFRNTAESKALDDYIQEVCSRATAARGGATVALPAEGGAEGGGAGVPADVGEEPGGEEPEEGGMPPGGDEEVDIEREPREPADEGDPRTTSRPDDKDKVEEPEDRDRPGHPRQPGGQPEDEDKKAEDPHDRDRPRHPRDPHDRDRDRPGHPGHAGDPHQQGQQQGQQDDDKKKDHSQKLLDTSRTSADQHAPSGEKAGKSKAEKGVAQPAGSGVKRPASPHQFSGQSDPGAASRSTDIGTSNIDTGVGGSTAGSQTTKEGSGSSGGGGGSGGGKGGGM